MPLMYFFMLLLMFMLVSFGFIVQCVTPAKAGLVYRRDSGFRRNDSLNNVKV